jgi:hypothetical protein
MRMKTRMISLSILAILTLCLLNVAAASTSDPTTAPHSKKVTDATAQQPTSITITAYPKQVKVGQDFDITGRLTSGNTGLGNKLIYHDFRDDNGTWWWDWNVTTIADGSFTDSMYYDSGGVGTHYLREEFWGDDQYAFCASDVMVITVVS